MPASILPFTRQRPSSDPTVRELVGLYWSLEAKIDSRRNKTAWQEVRRVLDRFEAAYSDLRVSELKKSDLRLLIEGNPRIKSDWTRGRWCRTIQRVFNWAAGEMEFIDRNPFRGVNYKDGARGRPLSEQEFAAIYSLALRTPRVGDYPLFLRIARLSGARPGELETARWAELVYDPQTWRGAIVKAEHKTVEKVGRARVIGLVPEAVKLLLAHKRALGCFPGLEPEHIFRNSHGKPWSKRSTCERFQKLREALGLPEDAKQYGARHGFATEAAERGLSAIEIADLLGHTSSQMAEHYIHTAKTPARLSELAERAMGGALAGAVPPAEVASQTLPFVAPAERQPVPAAPATPGLFDEVE